MKRQRLEVRGRTAEEAVAQGLAALGLPRDQVLIEIVEAGTKGFLGLGAREAVVALTANVPPDDAVRKATEDILAAGGFAATVAASYDETTRTVEVRVDGDDLGGLIGRHGRTLEALETVLNVACCHAVEGPRQVVLDIGGYRDRRAESLRRLAERVAETVRRTGRPVTLEPMVARERRLVHLALQDSIDVVTRSEGEDPDRRVVIERRSGPET